MFPPTFWDYYRSESSVFRQNSWLKQSHCHLDEWWRLASGQDPSHFSCPNTATSCIMTTIKFPNDILETQLPAQCAVEHLLPSQSSLFVPDRGCQSTTCVLTGTVVYGSCLLCSHCCKHSSPAPSNAPWQVGKGKQPSFITVVGGTLPSRLGPTLRDALAVPQTH